MSYLENKKIVVGVTAGAAIYKSLDLIRRFKKKGADVYPVMTHNATKLISPQLFTSIAGNETRVEMFGDFSGMGHIRLQEADIVCIAPATANFIGKIAGGIADDLLTTTVLASEVPLVVAPAMNSIMWEKSIVQENIKRLKAVLVGPDEGDLACGDVGYGRMAQVDDIIACCERALAPNSFEGKKVLVTAGPTREMWDDVRYISNRSSGRMGYSLAKEAWLRGAEVTLVSGPVSLLKPYGLHLEKVQTAEEMFEVVSQKFSECDYFISAAAVADFKPKKISGKIKKSNDIPTVELERNPDVLKWCSENKRKDQTLVGFALEDTDLKKRAHRKLEDKGCDFMVGNGLENMSNRGGEVVFVYQSGVSKELIGSKGEIACQIFDLVG